MPTSPHRLPTQVLPAHYHIRLHASPHDAAFEGKLTLELTVQEPTDTVWLHARGLAIDEAVLQWDGAPGAGVACQTKLHEETERLELSLPRTVPEGTATLEITYRGKVSRSMAGLYLSQDGDEVCLATQCEPTDARAIFPCFDEPSFKATIQWTVTTEPGLTVLANAPLDDRREDPEDRTVTWAFAPTERKIPTYLAAMAVGNFGHTEELVENGVPFRVHALGGKEELGRHANRFATELLPWYETYFDTAYPFQKYDQLAVPSFSFGAMENVGLVVFRASLLLMDPRTVSWQGQKRIDLVVAHEFAHMWFGNLVTMAWWDDLWLNEAFAEWIAHKVTDELVPDHEAWFEFQDRTDGALDTDALESTHAIYHPVETPEEAAEMFDAITYGKGAAVMRMLEAFLTPEAFRAGLRTYMDTFPEANARGSDLWDHLAEASDHPVDEIMASWVEQPGHPVLRVEHEPTDTGVRLTLNQERGRTTPTHGKGERGPTWHLPVVLRYRDEGGVQEKRHLLTEAQATVDLALDGKLAWLHPNAGGVGVYRIAPDDELTHALATHLDELDPAEQRSLLRDQWDLVRAGDRELGAFLDLLEATVDGDEHYKVVEHVAGRIRGFSHMLQVHGDKQALAGLQAWTVDRFHAALEALGTEGESDEPPAEGQRRATLLELLAGVAEHGPTLKAATALADRELSDPQRVDANLAGTVVKLAAGQGDRERFELHLATYQERKAGTASPQEADRYLHSLPSFREPELVEGTLKALSDGTVPKQSVGPLLVAMLGKPHSQEAAFEHIQARWSELVDGLGDAWIARIVEASSQLAPDQGKEVVAFYQEHLDGMAQQAFGRMTERLAQRQELYGRILDDLVAWAKAKA